MRVFVTINKNDLLGSDDDIKNLVKKKYPNGEYCFTICKNCGMYYHDFNGDTNNASIVDKCNHCLNK